MATDSEVEQSFVNESVESDTVQFTSGEEEQLSVLAAGILNVLGPAVKEIDDKVNQVRSVV